VEAVPRPASSADLGPLDLAGRPRLRAKRSYRRCICFTLWHVFICIRRLHSISVRYQLRLTRFLSVWALFLMLLIKAGSITILTVSPPFASCFAAAAVSGRKLGLLWFQVLDGSCDALPAIFRALLNQLSVLVSLAIILPLN